MKGRIILAIFKGDKDTAFLYKERLLMIYLDYAATTPMSDSALEVYLNVSRKYYGNPSSLHDTGSDAKQILEASRKAIAKILDAESDEIFFTGSGSEANQLAVKALLSVTAKKTGHLITTSVEHSSVRYFFNKLEKKGFDVTRLGVTGDGRIDMNELLKSIRPDTILASIQHVNSETGVIQDVEKIGKFLKEKGVLFHSDCVQSFCKIDVQGDWFDALSISAHKVYGPKGTGAVYISKGLDWKPEIEGTTQEKGLRAGTQDIAGIAAFAAASKLTYEDRLKDSGKFKNMRRQLLKGVASKGWKVIDEGSEKHKVPNVLGLRFPGIEGQFLMLECSQAGVAISTGSACQVGTDKPNVTMLAMGKTEMEAREFVRLSLGKSLNDEQIVQIIEKIDAILRRHFSKIKA